MSSFISVKYFPSQKRWFVFLRQTKTAPLIFLFSQKKIKGDASGQLSLALLYKQLRSFGLISI